MRELEEKIIDLTLENDRIKKTSKQRFDQNKKLKEKEKRLDILEGRFESLNGFIIENGFDRRFEHGIIERVDWSAINAITALQEKGESKNKPSVEGLYAVCIDGVYKLANIKHYISWQISFLDDDWEVIHFFKISDFVLIK